MPNQCSECGPLCICGLHPFKVGQRVVLHGLPGTVRKLGQGSAWGWGVEPAVSVEVDGQTDPTALYRVPARDVLPEPATQ